MPDTLTWGHVLTLLAALVAVYGVLQFSTSLRHRGHGPGTPGYARARDGRRFAAWSFAAAALILLLAFLTPLGAAAIGGAS